MRPTDGFTLIELVVVIVILGIVALIAAPRFFTTSTFDASRFHEAAISAMRYAQKVAVAQRTDVYVVTTATSVALCYNVGCTTPVPGADGSAAFVVTAPPGIAFATPMSFNFNALGQPNSNISRTFSITGDVSRQIVIEQETGYVHR